MRSFTNRPQQAGLVLSKPSSIKKGGFTCQWLGNVDMHIFAKYDQNMIKNDQNTPCGSRAMNIFTNC